MDGEVVDRFASILEICQPTRSQEPPLPDTRFLRLADTGNPRPLYCAIPADSLGDYLCIAPPETSNNHDQPYSPPRLESFLNPPPPPPPEGSLLAQPFDNQGIPAADHHHEYRDFNDDKVDDDGGFTDAETGKVSDQCLSRLKSMAKLEGFFDYDDVFFFTQFRFSEYWVSLTPPSPPSISKKRNLGSSSNLTESVSVSCEHSKKQKRKHSENILGLESTICNNSSGLIDVDGAFEVVGSDSSSESEGRGDLSSKLKGKDVAPKKQKYSEYTMGLKSSKSNIASELVETEGINVVVLSSSEKESSGASGIGDHDRVMASEVGGGSKADGDSHKNAECSSWSSKNTEELGKSRCVGSGTNSNRNRTPPAAGQCGVANKNATLMTALLDFMKISGIVNAAAQPPASGGDDDDNDFLKTAISRGMTFPRPRWWPPEGFPD